MTADDARALDDAGLLADPADRDECTCPWVDPKYWTTYYGAVEPGSTREYDPTCPAHGELRKRAERAEAEVAELRATVERVRALADRYAAHEAAGIVGYAGLADDLRDALDPAGGAPIEYRCDQCGGLSGEPCGDCPLDYHPSQHAD